MITHTGNPVDLLVNKEEAVRWANNDQLPAQNYYLRHGDEVTLDFGANICLSLMGMTPRHFEFHKDTGDLQTFLFQKPICFAHANGNSMQLLDTLIHARDTGQDLHERWSTAGARNVERTYEKTPRISLDAPQTNGAFVDAAQCFQGRGVLEIASFVSWRSSFDGLRIQVWRPKLGAMDGGPPVKFQLLAQSGVISTHDPMVKRAGKEVERDRHGPVPLFSWEVDLKHYAVRFQESDCLGWSYTDGGIFAGVHFEPWTDNVTFLEVGLRPNLGEVYEFTRAQHRHSTMHVMFLLDDGPTSDDAAHMRVKNFSYVGVRNFRQQSSHAHHTHRAAHFSYGGLRRLETYRNLGFHPKRILDMGALEGDWTRAAREVFPQAEFLMLEADPRHRAKLSSVGVEFKIMLLGDQVAQGVPFYTSRTRSRSGASLFREFSQAYYPSHVS